MSAGQHESVEVDVAPSEAVDADPDAETTAGSTESRAPSASSITEMLSSTEPSESPEVQDGTFSTGAAWYQHLELAVKKATGASGTPAWINAIMAAFLLAAESAGLDLGGADADPEAESSSSATEAESEASTSTPSTAGAGTPVGTHDNGETTVVEV